MKARKKNPQVQKVMRRRRWALFLAFVLFSAFLIHGLWLAKNRLLHIKPDQVESVDLMILPDSQVVNLDRKEDLDWIMKKLRPMTGQPKPLQGAVQNKVYFIHMNLKGQDPIDLSKSGDQVAIDGTWYRVKRGDLNRIDKIFSAYFEDTDSW